jgi:hypothetical protein
MRHSPNKPLSPTDDDCWVEGHGIVIRLLHDDRQGARHQRFIVDQRNGQTLLVAHNLDIAARVPLGLGDRVQFRGLYEWNDLGGIVHWTHRDPRGEEPGGYIVLRDKIYA